MRALDGLSLDVAAGSVFALLGPNGAGKSTTVKILTTLSRPDSGRASVAGIDVLATTGRRPAAHRTGSQKASTDPMATARENLVLAGRIQGMSPPMRAHEPTNCCAASTSTMPPTDWRRPSPAACPASSTSPLG